MKATVLKVHTPGEALNPDTFTNYAFQGLSNLLGKPFEYKDWARSAVELLQATCKAGLFPAAERISEDALLFG